MHAQLSLKRVLLADALAQAARQLAAASDSARADAEVLLAHTLGCTRAQLHARGREALAPADEKSFQQMLARRQRREPVAYITGEQGFWTLTLKVTPAALIPRPETELLVEWGLECLRDAAKPRVADLGTGSGCIALALAVERPDAAVSAIDISVEALALARENSAALKISNVEFLEAGFAQFLAAGAAFDLLVSNPPYVAAGDTHLQDLRHEPLMALSDGGDGLNCLREIVAAAPARLKTGGWLLVEHGFDQAAAVRELFAGAGFGGIESRRDLGGHERVTGGRLA